MSTSRVIEIDDVVGHGGREFDIGRPLLTVQ